MIKHHTFECSSPNIGDMRADFHGCNMGKYIGRDILPDIRDDHIGKKADNYHFPYKLTNYP